MAPSNKTVASEVRILVIIQSQRKSNYALLEAGKGPLNRQLY